MSDTVVGQGTPHGFGPPNPNANLAREVGQGAARRLSEGHASAPRTDHHNPPPPGVHVTTQKMCPDTVGQGGVFTQDKWVYALCGTYESGNQRATLYRVLSSEFGSSAAKIEQLPLTDKLVVSQSIRFSSMLPGGDLIVQTLWGNITSTGYAWHRVTLGEGWQVAVGPVRSGPGGNNGFDASAAMPVAGSDGKTVAIVGSVTARTLDLTTLEYTSPLLYLNNRSGTLLSQKDGVFSSSGNSRSIAGIAMFNEFQYRFHPTEITDLSAKGSFAKIDDVARLPDEPFAMWRDWAATGDRVVETLVTRSVRNDNESVIITQAWELGVGKPRMLGEPVVFDHLPRNMTPRYFSGNGYLPVPPSDASASAPHGRAAASTEAFFVADKYVVRTRPSGAHTVIPALCEGCSWYIQNKFPPLPRVGADGRLVVKSYDKKADTVVVAAIDFGAPE